MRRPRPGIGTEILPIAMILAGMAGTLGLVITMHRRVAVSRLDAPADPPPRKVVVPPAVGSPGEMHATAVPTLPEPPSEARPEPEPELPPLPAEDPTKPILARLSAEDASHRKSAEEANRQAEALESARQAALAEVEKWKKRDDLVREKIHDLDTEAEQLEAEADALAMERDMLAEERDAALAAVARAKARAGGYAVLPHRGANGTWQRPVMIECRNGEAILQPHGLHFSMLDLSPMLAGRSSPLVAAVAREMVRVQDATSPDGSPVTPYIYFIVRPDGIRPYYDARAQLERLGIAFGYELVDGDWQIDFPNFDELTAWDGTGVEKPKHRSGATGTLADRDKKFVWPVDRPRGNGAPGPGGGPGSGLASAAPVSGTGNGSGTGPRAGAGATVGGGGTRENPYIWPTTPPGRVAGTDTAAELDALLEDLAHPGETGLNPGALAGTGASTGSPPGFDGTRPGGAGGPGLGGLSEPGLGGGGRPGLPVRPSPGGIGPGGVAGLTRVPAGSIPGFDPPGSPARSKGPGHGQGGSANDPSGIGFLSGGPGDPGANNEESAGSTGLGSAMTGTGVRPGLLAGGDRGSNPGTSSSSASGETGSNAGMPPGTLAGTAADPGQSVPRGTGRPGGQPPQGGRVMIDPEALAQEREQEEVWDRFPSSANGDPSGDAEGGTGGGSAASGLGKPPTVPGLSGLASLGRSLPGSGGGSPSGSQTNSRMTAARRAALGLPSLGPNTIEVPLDLVVACDQSGVTIHPGGYRLSREALNQKGRLRHDLLTIVRNHELIDSTVHPRPRVQFLVEQGGSETFEEARRQTVLAGIDWPVAIKVSESNAPRIFPKERF